MSHDPDMREGDDGQTHYEGDGCDPPHRIEPPFNPFGLPDHIIETARQLHDTAARLLTYCDACLLDNHDDCTEDNCGCDCEEDDTDAE